MRGAHPLMTETDQAQAKTNALPHVRAIILNQSLSPLGNIHIGWGWREGRRQEAGCKHKHDLPPTDSSPGIMKLLKSRAEKSGEGPLLPFSCCY